MADNDDVVVQADQKSPDFLERYHKVYGFTKKQLGRKMIEVIEDDRSKGYEAAVLNAVLNLASALAQSLHMDGKQTSLEKFELLARASYLDVKGKLEEMPNA